MCEETLGRILRGAPGLVQDDTLLASPRSRAGAKAGWRRGHDETPIAVV